MKKIFIIMMVVLMAFSIPCQASVFDDVMEKLNLAELTDSDIGADRTFVTGDSITVGYTVENMYFSMDGSDVARDYKIEIEYDGGDGFTKLDETSSFNLDGGEIKEGTKTVVLDLPVGDYELRIQGRDYYSGKWTDAGRDDYQITITDGSVTEETTEETTEDVTTENDTETQDVLEDEELTTETEEDDEPDITFDDEVGEKESVTQKLDSLIGGDDKADNETNWLLYGGIGFFFIIVAVAVIGGAVYLGKKK